MDFFLLFYGKVSIYTAPVHQVVMLVLEKKCPKSITVKLVFINKNDSVAQYSRIYALVRFFVKSL